MSDNTTDFFDGVGAGAGSPSAVLANVGDFVHGEIVEMFKRDFIPYGKKDPEKREDGTNKQQLVVILQTENRNWANVSRIPRVDPSDENSAEKDPSEDDGKRAVYVPEGKNIQFAIGRAVTAAGSKPAVGGTLGVKITELKDTGKGNPLKVHEAVYQAPSAAGNFFPEQQSAATPAATPEAAAPAPSSPAIPAEAPAAQDPWATSSAPAASQPPF